jgi:hypothetical protein
MTSILGQREYFLMMSHSGFDGFFESQWNDLCSAVRDNHFSFLPCSSEWSRLSDALVSTVPIQRHYCSFDVVSLSVIRNGTCAYSFRGCDLWSYSLLSFRKRRIPSFTFVPSLLLLELDCWDFSGHYQNPLANSNCNWFCYSVFQWDCKALVPSTSKAPLQHACWGCD